MSSNHPADLPLATRICSPHTWSLRTRLVVVLVVLLACVCAAVGAGTLLATERFLLRQLDNQVRDAASRSATFYDLGPPPGLHFEGPGPVFLDAPGQSTGTAGAVVVGGRVDEAAVISIDGTREQLSMDAASQLGDVPTGHPVREFLDGVGEYELIAIPAADGNYVVAGLSLEGVNQTLVSLMGIFWGVAAVALIVAVAAGVVVIRRQFAPLSRVALAARRVAQLELDRGEVCFPTVLVGIGPQSPYTEVGQLGMAFDQMLDRIADALSARHASEMRVRQFVADASHELRTPLACISGYTELVALRAPSTLPPDLAYAISRVDAEAKRMTRLVGDMLLLARMDAGCPLEFGEVDVCVLAADIVMDARVTGPEHQWSVQVPDEPVIVTGDGVRLHQVLANLLSNARIHTPPGTHVSTTLSCPEGGLAVLRVTDDGPGIPQHQQPEIFERFTRGDSSRSRRAGSTGLGLAIVSSLVKSHNGTIALHSVPGATTFTITLPRVHSTQLSKLHR
ncbi:cell wall metabolism sensor histidine kinase WalK [Mycobacterium sp. 141]|uniref:sensor histidine kinase n=1 Tax=Mycobacterium sp. 141 TaxID=1120797 RepID=UPI00035CBF6E|nr:HAMP domain-containing sensor histidine kinase [Mycobacterium sp. 141]